MGLPERPAQIVGSNLNHIVAGDPYQLRASRLDAALRAADRAHYSLFSSERELRRFAEPLGRVTRDCNHPECADRGGGTCLDEVYSVKVMAMTLVLVRYWPLATAQRLAEAFFAKLGRSGTTAAGQVGDDGREKGVAS